MSKFNKHKVFAVFDISSSSVAGAHVLLKNDKDTKAVFLASARSDATLQEDLNINRFVEETLKNLESVITKIQKADVHKPSYIQIVLASPWYNSQTRSIIYKKDGSQFFCTQKFIDSLINKEVDYILNNEQGSFGTFGKESMIIERQISQIKLNGYQTSKPYGKYAETLEIALTITIAPKMVLDRFTDVLRRNYGTRKIGFTTSPYATFIVARDHMAQDDECVVIDVGEEVTDIAFVKNGLFLYQHSFPVGTYALYRHASSGRENPTVAKALLESYRLNKLSTSEVVKVEKAISNFRLQWQEGLQKVLDSGHYGFCMPEHCFILSDPRFELIFTDIINTDPFIQHTCSRGIVKPIFVANNIIGGIIKSSDASPVDTPLAVGSLFVDRLI